MHLLFSALRTPALTVLSSGQSVLCEVFKLGTAVEGTYPHSCSWCGPAPCPPAAAWLGTCSKTSPSFRPWTSKRTKASWMNSQSDYCSPQALRDRNNRWIEWTAQTWISLCNFSSWDSLGTGKGEEREDWNRAVQWVSGKAVKAAGAVRNWKAIPRGTEISMQWETCPGDR